MTDSNRVNRISVLQRLRRKRVDKALQRANLVLVNVFSDPDLKGMEKRDLIEVAKRRAHDIVGNPVLVLIVLQLLPVLIEWFLKWRSDNANGLAGTLHSSAHVQSQLMQRVSEETAERLNRMDTSTSPPNVAVMTLAKQCDAEADNLPHRFDPALGASAADWLRLIAALMKIFANCLDWLNDE